MCGEEAIGLEHRVEGNSVSTPLVAPDAPDAPDAQRPGGPVAFVAPERPMASVAPAVGKINETNNQHGP